MAEKQTYLETIEDIQALYGRLRDEHNLPHLRIQHAARRGTSPLLQMLSFSKIQATMKRDVFVGYFLSLNGPVPPASSGSFIEVVQQGQKCTFSTEELVNLNLRCQESLEEIFLLTARYYSSLYFSSFHWSIERPHSRSFAKRARGATRMRSQPHRCNLQTLRLHRYIYFSLTTTLR
jgi:hypothetical protein